MDEYQGPKTHRRIKNWCHGRCMGILAELDILVEAMGEANSNHKEWANKLAKEMSSDLIKLIRGLARGTSS